MFSWFRRTRLAGDGALTPHRIGILGRNVWQHRWLPGPMRAKHHAVVAQMLADRRWEAAGGFRLTDEARVTIAGAAALLVVGLDEPYAFERVPSIIVRPRAFGTNGESRLGEAWHRGPIVLSWADCLRSCRRPVGSPNVVIHEFAHHIDNLGGQMDGDPAFPLKQARRWRATVDEEHARLVGQARRGEATLLDRYGATNRAEFFAVSTECFLTRPHELRERHASLYEQLCELYRQDPTTWIPPLQHGPTRRFRRPRMAPRVELSHLGLTPADAAFTRALALAEQGHHGPALVAADEALDADPDDAEALTCRAAIHLALENYEQAAEDATRAAQIDPRHAEPATLAAEALIALGEDEAAWPHAERAYRLEKDSFDANLWCGVLALGRGRPRWARRRLQTAVRLDPFDDEAHYWLAEAQQRLGRSDRAEWHRRRSDVLAGGERDAYADGSESE